MKTLLLASSGRFITEYTFDQYLPKKIKECRIAYITTASKKVDDVGYIERHKRRMDELGFLYEEIDIATQSEKKLRSTLQEHDIVMVEGGNTFYLLNAVRESGFEKIVKELIEKGVVYIGSSAGSYIACPSIIVATWSNPPVDQCGVTDYTSMNLVPFLIKAHYTPDMYDRLLRYRNELQHPLYAIGDEQAILVRDGNIQLLGPGKEVIFSPSTPGVE